jgi:hypothetical protein
MKKKPPRDVKRLQLQLEMEKMIVAGNSPSQIMSWLKISRRTYFRYFRQLFREDKAILQAKREEDVMTSYAVLKGRLSQLYQDARKIIESDSSSDGDRLSAMDFAANISVALGRLSIEAPVALFLQTPKDKRILVLKDNNNNNKMTRALTPYEQQAELEKEEKERAMFRQKRALFIPGEKLTVDELKQKDLALKYQQQQRQENEEEDDDEEGEQEDG